MFLFLSRNPKAMGRTSIRHWGQRCKSCSRHAGSELDQDARILYHLSITKKTILHCQPRIPVSRYERSSVLLSSRKQTKRTIAPCPSVHEPTNQPPGLGRKASDDRRPDVTPKGQETTAKDGSVSLTKKLAVQSLVYKRFKGPQSLPPCRIPPTYAVGLQSCKS